MTIAVTQKKKSPRNKEKAYILKEIEVNGKLLFLQITPIYLKVTYYCSKALWSQIS